MDEVQSYIRNVFQRKYYQQLYLEDTRGKHVAYQAQVALPSLHAPIRKSREVYEVMSSKSQIRCFSIRAALLMDHSLCSMNTQT